ncbi:MAG: hypothetical protein AB7V62_04655 [Thermoleophilia bacterium]
MAVPWGLVAAGCLVAGVLLAVAAAEPSALWPLQGTAAGVLAACAAWSADERAAAVTDALPRPLWWRTAARAAATVPLAVVWAAAVLIVGDRLPDHTELLVRQGLVALVCGLALATWARSRGVPEPGRVLGPVLVVVVAALALARPVPDRLPLFPIWPGEPWALSGTLWWSVLGAACLVLASAIVPGVRRSPR